MTDQAIIITDSDSGQSTSTSTSRREASVSENTSATDASTQTAPPSSDEATTTRSSRRQAPRNRNWLMTINRDPQVPTELPPGVRYMCGQIEVSPTTGHDHLQAFVQMESPKSLRTMRTLFGHHHFDSHSYGTAQDMRDYCMKEATRKPGEEPFELGIFVSRGKRKDLEEFRDRVKAGDNKRQLLETHASVIARYPRFYSEVKSLFKPDREWEGNTLVIGPTGAGKTHHMYEQSEDLWAAPVGKGCWFDGYDSHDVALFDDFAGEFPLTSMLQLLDRRAVYAPVKGSYVWFNPKKVVITTNIHPKDWYNWRGREDQRNALYRRFTTVLEFHSRGNWTTHSTDFETVGDEGRHTERIPYFDYSATVTSNERFL